MLVQTQTSDFEAGITAAMPVLRRYALLLCRSNDGADDLLQETMLKAWKHQARFEPGSNLNAWLFTILRNSFLSQKRKTRREVQDVDGIHSARLCSAPAHDAVLDLRDFRTALAVLPKAQSQALVLVGGYGHSYQEAAVLAGCESGTIKSRVSRARRQLLNLMRISGPMDFAAAMPATAPAPRHAYA